MTISAVYTKIHQLREENADFIVSLDTPVARLAAPLVAFTDIGLQTIASPLSAIESIAKAALSLIRFLFLKRDAIHQFLIHSESALCRLVTTPVALLMAPLKFLYQTAMLMKDPERNAQSFHLGDDRQKARIARKYGTLPQEELASV